MFSQSSSSPPAPTRRPVTPTLRPPPRTPSPSTSKSCAQTSDAVPSDCRKATRTLSQYPSITTQPKKIQKKTGSPLVAVVCGSIPQDLAQRIQQCVLVVHAQIDHAQSDRANTLTNHCARSSPAPQSMHHMQSVPKLHAAVRTLAHNLLV